MLRVAVQKRRGDFSLDARFDAPTPAVVALYGPSGCGKSTIVSLVAGLLEPDAAHIELDGLVLCDTASGVKVPAESRRIGCVFQDARLFPHMNVRRNLMYGLTRNRSAGTAIAFDDVVALLGLGGLLERRPATLSGGERQRIALGRALLSQPRLLLLDEPLAALDIARRDEILPYLERLRDHWRLPMLYVSHQFDEVVRLATHVVVLEAGRVTAAGPLGRVALDPALAQVAGEASVGAVLDTSVAAVDEDGLCRVKAGGGELRIVATGLAPGARIRLQVLARDVVVATRQPEGLSIRNALAGEIASVTAESAASDLVAIDVGGETIVARVTRAASRELGLVPRLRVWALVKAVSVRGAAL
jgi:molybdate transport system ATP-binding protein